MVRLIAARLLELYCFVLRDDKNAKMNLYFILIKKIFMTFSMDERVVNDDIDIFIISEKRFFLSPFLKL